eukprot:720966-Pleurochrysis_carterae.AAC.2
MKRRRDGATTKESAPQRVRRDERMVLCSVPGPRSTSHPPSTRGRVSACCSAGSKRAMRPHSHRAQAGHRPQRSSCEEPRRRWAVWGRAACAAHVGAAARTCRPYRRCSTSSLTRRAPSCNGHTCRRMIGNQSHARHITGRSAQQLSRYAHQESRSEKADMAPAVSLLLPETMS